MKITHELIEKLYAGDSDTIAHVNDGVNTVGKDDAVRLMAYVVQAMTRQSDRGTEGAKTKLALYSIFFKLESIVIPPIGEYKDERELVQKLMEIPDSAIAACERYENLVALTMNGPVSALAGLDARARETVLGTAEHSYDQTIKTGAAIARARSGKIKVEPGYVEAATACLLNTLHYGNIVLVKRNGEYVEADTSRYAYEMLETVPGANATDYLLEKALNGEGEVRTRAIQALLTHYSDDEVAMCTLGAMADKDSGIKGEIISMANAGKEQPLGQAAGKVLSHARAESDLDKAIAAKETLIEVEYADPTCPRKMYVELVFGAVETVLGTIPVTASQDDEYEAAVRQLYSVSAKPEQIGSLFEDTPGDSRRHGQNYRILQANVENALLHVLTTNPNASLRKLAAKGLEATGSDQVEAILDKIVERHGEKDEVGKLASYTLAGIRSKWAVEEPSRTFKAPPKPAAQPRKTQTVQ